MRHHLFTEQQLILRPIPLIPTVSECARAAHDQVVVRADGQGSNAMSSPPVVDREVVEHSFREWQEEQTLLDAQLAESVDALDAYQSHLDSWQQELARERDELRLMREAIERDLAAGGAHCEQIEVLNRELTESRAKVSSLTAALLERTEELRDLERERETGSSELAAARARQLELESALAAQREASEVQHQGESHTTHENQGFDNAVEQAAASNQGGAAKNGSARVEPRRTTSPVLGSVMEQFGKLREQRSMNRSNNKPR